MTILSRPPMIALLAILCLQNYCSAQEKSKVQFGKVSAEDFKVPSSVIVDSSTNAVVLSDVGSVKFVGNKNSWFSYVYKKQTRIRILNKKAVDLATIDLHLYAPDANSEKVDDIQGSSYNLENGQVVETKLDKKDIFEKRENKTFIGKRFTLPGVKEGTIIEYTYTLTSEYIFNLPSWTFQSVLNPTVWSEYDVTIPQTLFYVIVKQGYHPFAIDKGSEGHESYRLTENEKDRPLGVENKDFYVTAATIKHRWVMKDVPPFHVEGYLTTPRNYIDKISFQLEKTYNGEDTHDVMNSWKVANERLLKRDDFGAAFTQDGNEWMDDLINRIGDKAKDRLELAKKIYYYVSGHFTCTDDDDVYITTTLRDVVKNNSGTVGDINLLLTALLKRMNFTADPVLLSTREHGFNLVKYPVMSLLNYVVVRVKIDGKIYYLDAAQPRLGFGQLAGNCYNGHARIISEKDSASIYFEADSLKEAKSTMVFLTNGDKGMEGTYQSVLGPQDSYNIRQDIAKRGKAAYFKGIKTGYGEDIDLSNEDIDSLEELEQPVKVHYDFNLKSGSDASIIYFNPLFGDAWKENPFKAADRKYPVEMPYVTDELYVMNMEIPKGYMVDEIPKSARVAFNGDQGMFEYLIAKQENMIQLRCRVRLSHANFSPEDYSSLRDFYGYIVKKESEQIVLKKQ